MEKLTIAVGFSFSIQFTMQQIRLVFIIIFSFVTFTGFLSAAAQAQNHPSFVSLQSGLSIPFGGYSSTKLEEGSFTQTGFNATAEGAWFFSKHFGAGLSAGLNLHPVDVSALGRAQVNNEPFLTDVTIRSEPYRVITVMPGLFVGFQLSEKWFINGKLLAGMLHGKTPYQLYKPDYYLLPDEWEEITSSTDYKFSWQAGFTIHYQVTSCIAISLNSSILYDELQFTFQTAQGSRTDNRKIGMINLMPGINIIL